MNFHTDLAIERQDFHQEIQSKNIKTSENQYTKVKESIIDVLNEQGANEIGKPIGKYITLEIPEFSHESELLDERLARFIHAVNVLLPSRFSSALVAGLGNDNITPDALGPKVIENIFATSHIDSLSANQLGLSGIHPVSAISFGVLGQTGLESARILKDIVLDIKPDVLILIDALATQSRHRLGNTIQLTNTGIVPGSGVGNHRSEISQNTLGIPVVAIGIPTVIDLEIFTENKSKEYTKDEISSMMVCPRDIDTIIQRASKFLGFGLNCALQPSLSPELLLSVV